MILSYQVGTIALLISTVFMDQTGGKSYHRRFQDLELKTVISDSLGRSRLTSTIKHLNGKDRDTPSLPRLTDDDQ